MSKNYREQANQLAEQLTPKNKAFFGKIQQYLGLSSIFLDEEKLNEQIYQIAVDLVEAQSHGERAEEFFGQDSQAIADELLKNTPPSSWKSRFKLVTFIVAIFWLAFMITDFGGSKVATINPLFYAMSIIIVPIYVGLFIQMTKKSVYQKVKNKYLDMFKYGMLPMIFLGISGYIATFLPNTWNFTISFPYNVLIIGLFIVIMLICDISSRFGEGWRGLYRIGALVGCCGLVQQALYYFTNWSEEKITLIGLALIGVIVVGVVKYLEKKEAR
ncbi:DUF1129 family protein [Vagococcus xieshaowenii]|uniref:DUF1129 family protein n=1 Tax=Vagococcus xieshaowenii TaxID=2562451 RepID=A0AAJ5JQK0_9ENTE|nr:DUF1129 family protein [Vagococcus xieshaowenii]QCA27955.1 DUF1129 family protein [Vagococcus xieshaowenii]TFZ41277.1 DUF1129 family protein [Vagococcus xieshaowenii]